MGEAKLAFPKERLRKMLEDEGTKGQGAGFI